MVKTETKHSDAEQLVRSKLDELIQFRSQTDDIKEFWGKQFDLGLAWVQFPEGAGGLGLNPKYQLIITETLRNEGISQQNRVANILGIGMGAPTIVEYGTPEQIQTFLRPMFTTEEIWWTASLALHMWHEHRVGTAVRKQVLSMAVSTGVPSGDASPLNCQLARAHGLRSSLGKLNIC